MDGLGKVKHIFFVTGVGIIISYHTFAAMYVMLCYASIYAPEPSLTTAGDQIEWIRSDADHGADPGQGRALTRSKVTGVGVSCVSSYTDYLYGILYETEVVGSV